MLISLCIPTYSRLEYLKEAVASIYAQTFKDYEICVSLDPKISGPDMDIHNWCLKEALKNPIFRYQKNNQNVGLAGNWNLLANFARGEYVMIIGDDDTLNPTYFEEISKIVISYKSDVAFSNQNFIDEDGNVLEELTKKLNNDYHRSELKTGLIENPIATVLRNTVPMSSALIKREHLLTYRFDESLNTPELEVFLKIALNNGVFAYCDKKLANYRVHSNSATSGGLTNHLFVKNLIAIRVPSEYEPLKYELVSSLIIPAVNICIKSKNTRLGKSLLNSPYYPSNKLALRIIQRILFLLPASFVRMLYKLKS